MVKNVEDSLVLDIYGRVYSKKNSRVLTRRGGRVVSLPSSAFERFRKDALKQIGHVVRVMPPYEVRYLFEMKGLGATDIDNMIAGINDILQEAGAIQDDKHIHSVIAQKAIGADEYYTQVWIKSIP